MRPCVNCPLTKKSLSAHDLKTSVTVVCCRKHPRRDVDTQRAVDSCRAAAGPTALALETSVLGYYPLPTGPTLGLHSSRIPPEVACQSLSTLDIRCISRYFFNPPTSKSRTKPQTADHPEKYGKCSRPGTRACHFPFLLVRQRAPPEPTHQALFLGKKLLLFCPAF